MFVGILGVLVPVIPDMALIWLAALSYGLLVGWGTWGGWIFVAITLLAIAGAAAEIGGGGVGARVGGASVWAIIGGLVLGVIGLVFFTPLGGVVALLLGTFLVDYLRLKDSRRALRGMLGMGIGYGLAFFVKLGLALVMVGLWLIWALSL